MTNISEKTTNSGKRGGNLVGKPHYTKSGKDAGGIKAVVTDNNNQPVELEGGEVIINKEASKKHWQELSRINQSAGNGVPIGPPIDPHEADVDEYKKGGKIDFNPNKVPNKWILKYAENIKKNHPEIWDLGGNVFGNEAFINLKRVAERGYWLDSEEWMMIKWRSYVARHKKDYRIAGVVAMLKWVDKVDKGWPYMKDLIETEIRKRKNKRKLGGKASLMYPQKGKTYMLSMSNNGIVIEATDGYHQVDMTFDSITDANKYAKKHKFPLRKKLGYNMKEGGQTKGMQRFPGLKSKKVFIEKIKERFNVQPITGSGDLMGRGRFTEHEIRDYRHPETNEKLGQLCSDGKHTYIAIANFREGGQTKAQKKKFATVMSEFEDGKLRSGSKKGPIVKNKKQAVAIAYSESEKYDTGGNITISGDEYSVGDEGRWNGNKVLDIQITKITGSSVFFADLTNDRDVRKKKVDFNKLFVPEGKMLPSKAQKKNTGKTSKRQAGQGFTRYQLKTSYDPAVQNDEFSVGDFVKLRIDILVSDWDQGANLQYAVEGPKMEFEDERNQWEIVEKNTFDNKYVYTIKNTGTDVTLNWNFGGEMLTAFDGSTAVAKPVEPDPEPKKKEPRKPLPQLKRESYSKNLDYLSLFKTYIGQDAKEQTGQDIAMQTNLTYLATIKSEPTATKEQAKQTSKAKPKKAVKKTTAKKSPAKKKK